MNFTGKKYISGQFFLGGGGGCVKVSLSTAEPLSKIKEAIDI